MRDAVFGFVSCHDRRGKPLLQPTNCRGNVRRGFRPRMYREIATCRRPIAAYVYVLYVCVGRMLVVDHATSVGHTAVSASVLHVSIRAARIHHVV